MIFTAISSLIDENENSKNTKIIPDIPQRKKQNNSIGDNVMPETPCNINVAMRAGVKKIEA